MNKSKKCSIISWNATALWDLKVENNICILCRNNIMDVCVSCSSKNISECNIVTSTCNCVVHHHCIANYNKGNPNCPKHTSVKWEYIYIEQEGKM
jgi:RING-box protein 1